LDVSVETVRQVMIKNHLNINGTHGFNPVQTRRRA
jgi:hypothetical protein